MSLSPPLCYRLKGRLEPACLIRQHGEHLAVGKGAKRRMHHYLFRCNVEQVREVLHAK